MKDPDNIRNRWRRYREARKAYNFSYLPFRAWAITRGKNSDAYKGAGFADEEVKLVNGRA